MPKTCLTCLSHDNLLDLGEREWKVLEYLVNPFKGYLNQLKTNENSGICSKCQTSIICIDQFRVSAMANFVKVMEMWKKEKKKQQINKIQTTIEAVVSEDKPVIKREKTPFNDDNLLRPQQNDTQNIKIEGEKVFIKDEPCSEDIATDAVNKDPGVKVEDLDDYDDDGSLVTKDATTKIMLANVLQNMYVAQPPPVNAPPCTIKVVDVGKLKNAQTEEQMETEEDTSDTELEPCEKSRKKIKQKVRKCTKKTKNYTEEANEVPPIKKSHTDPQTSTNKPLKCDYCSLRFESQEDKQNHMDTAHDSAPAKICEICQIPFHSVYKYNTHMKTHKTMVYCDVCDRWYSANTYKMHMRTSRKHNKVEDFKHACKECDARFPLKTYLDRHVISVHKKLKPYKCSLCPVAYARPFRLKEHVSTTHKKQPPEKKHTCAECGIKMRQKKELEAHMVRHTGERPYKCKICLSTFGYKAALYTHNKLMHEYVRRPKKIGTESKQDNSGAKQGDSDATMENSDAKQGDSDATMENSDVKQGDSDVTMQNSDAKQADSDATMENSDVKQADSDAKQRDSDATMENSDVKQADSDATMENSDAKQRDSDATMENSDVKQGDSDATMENSDVKQGDSDATMENSDAKLADSDAT